MILAEMTKDSKTYRWSLVKQGANQRDFLKLAEEKPLMMAYDDEKQEVTGALLIPDQKIYRRKEFFEANFGISEDGYIYFTAETIKEQAISFLEHYEPVNLNHETQTEGNAVQLVESWLITTEQDKTYGLGLSSEDYPLHTWMGTQRINDPELWAECKAGRYNAFSIEAMPVMNIIATGVDLQHQYDEDELVDIIVDIIMKEHNYGNKSDKQE